MSGNEEHLAFIYHKPNGKDLRKQPSPAIGWESYGRRKKPAVHAYTFACVFDDIALERGDGLQHGLEPARTRTSRQIAPCFRLQEDTGWRRTHADDLAALQRAIDRQNSPYSNRH
ncbi:MAG: hypothetical protein QM659_13440 [Rhodomicrobium sp.]